MLERLCFIYTILAHSLPLHCLGNSYFQIFRKTFVSYMHSPLPLFTWAFASLPLTYLLYTNFCTSFISATCPILCPFQLGHLLQALLVSIVHTLVLVEVFSSRYLSFCHFILDIFSEAPLCWFSPYLFSSLLQLSFRHISLVCPLALNVFSKVLQYYLASSTHTLFNCWGLPFLDIFSLFAHLFRYYLSGSSLEPFTD